MTMSSALQELASFPRDLSLNRLASPCDPKRELHKLSTVVMEMQAAAASMRPPDPAESQGLIARCRAQGFRLDGFRPRDVKLLAWDSEMLMNATFRLHLSEFVRERTVRPHLIVLSKVYFAGWGRHEQPEIFEQMLRKLAHSQNGYTPTLGLYKANANEIFSGAAHTFLGRLVVRERKPILSILSAWDIGPTTPLTSAVIDCYIDNALADLSLGRETVLDELIPNLQIPAVTTRSIQRAAGAMILSSVADKSESAKKRIETFVLDDSRLGDPRLPQNIPRWVGVDPAAERKFRTWRATKDLVFFFKTVMRDGTDPHGRKDFWLRYVDKVVDSVVALCPTDLQRLRQSLSQERVHHCKILENQQVSCFMMRFKGSTDDLLVAEFSNVGRVRIFIYRKFIENVGDINKSEFRLKELKTDEGLVESFVHTPLWKSNVRGTLAQFGIRER
jgi:hypothetical protein